MRPESEYRQAIELIEAGIHDCEVGRRPGIARGTIRDWRVGLASGSGGRTRFWSGRRNAPTCFRCTESRFDEEAYAYLLGEYLGDGCLSLMPRDVHRLRIACDLRYPDIIDEIASSIVITRGVEQVGFIMNTGCVEVYSDWKHWYRYTRYVFTNVSTDILGIYADALDRLEVH